ncbi:MAG TPA: succinate dehydrogenase assembly factor 2 [Gammaproteobacteria bacterium]|nr:succinate dehydrogenase assembly factor 2 [Gammaproteobacteria bacterium]
MKKMKRSAVLAPLRWACRRGMLELDLILERFLDRGFLALAPAEQKLFRAFLNHFDQDLFAWLVEGRKPPDARFLPLIKKIQEYNHVPTST